MKKVVTIFTAFLTLLILFATSSQSTYAASDVTSSFSYKMRYNALQMAYYAQHDKSWPIGTGYEFASKVKSNGVWDYKRTYGATTSYIFAGSTLKGEDLGNMHYGYVGRASGFGSTLLKSAAGAVQIYSGTALFGWYTTYFDDPKDQKYIDKGINYWSNVNLPSSASMTTSLSKENTISKNSVDEAPESIFTQEEINTFIANDVIGKAPKSIFSEEDFKLLSDKDKKEIEERADQNAKIILEELNK